MARSRRLGRAREILAFLGKKVGKLYFWEKVVSTFPLALFDHFQKFTCAEKNFFSALRADEIGVFVCVDNIT